MHIQSSTVTLLLLSTVALLSNNVPGTEAHSWMDCVDWKFNNPSKKGYADNEGHCTGYARRFPFQAPFGTLDSANPSRHYQQDNKDPDNALPCANHHDGKDIGSDETLADPPEDAYGGKYGDMTHTYSGDQLCIRWPAKNHAEKNENQDMMVQIYFSEKKDSKDPTQKQLLNTKDNIELKYINCGNALNPKTAKDKTDKRPCGGCITVPNRDPGRYLMQWRWMLNPDEWYTSCADVMIENKAQ